MNHPDLYHEWRTRDDMEGDPTHLNTVLVYRLDSKTKAMVPLGVLVERRNKERGDNVISMLRRARKEFAKTEKEATEIFIKYG